MRRARARLTFPEIDPHIPPADALQVEGALGKSRQWLEDLAARSQITLEELIEGAADKGGLHFGTDGSTRALWEYLRLAHDPIAPARARTGDVLFFDTQAGDAAPDCDDVTDHAGIVESVEPDGRILFVEARGGQVRRSVVDPSHPTLRRNARGEIANSFLRAKLVADPPNARYFAGQMLCGVARVER